jgi:ElaB/YqjD/DUF883 family membrane-anchored ribosome-binding protein
MPASAKSLPSDLTNVARDFVYLTVGFGVLAVQRLQAQRHELSEQFNSQLGAGRDGVSKLSGVVDAQVKSLESRFTALEERVDAVLDQVEAKLPEQARGAVHQARTAARTARDQVRDQVRGLVHRAA